MAKKVRKSDRLIIVLLLLSILFSVGSIFVNLSGSFFEEKNDGVSQSLEGTNSGSISLFVEEQSGSSQEQGR